MTTADATQLLTPQDETSAPEESAASTDAPTADAEARLSRIARQHTPYNDHQDEATGLMCRECGYLDPCPTRRMTFSDINPIGPWFTTIAP